MSNQKKLSWWLSIFDNVTTGASIRKVAGFIGLILAVFITVKLTTPTLLFEVLTAWLTFVLGCFGIITAQQLINTKLTNTVKNEVK